MSILNTITEQTGAKGSLPATENFALQVLKYDRDAGSGEPTIIGTRLDTGEEVTVFLRPYRGANQLKAPRAEVKDFVAKEGEISTLMQQLPTEELRRQVLKGQVAKTEPGGTIIVQRGFVDSKTGMVSAGWLQSAAKYPNHAKVVANVMLRVDPVTYRDNGPATSTVTAINPGASTLVKSQDQLAGALIAAFGGNRNEVGGRNGALIRLTDGTTNKAIELMLPRVKDKQTEQYSDMAPADAAARFLATPNGKQIAAFAGNPDLKVEVVPMARLVLGSQTKASYEKSAGKLDAVNTAYRLVKDDPEETAFASSYIVIHRVGEGEVFTQAQPLSNKPALFHARDVATPHFNGKSVTLEIKGAPQEEAPEPLETAGDDIDFDVNEVVAAATASESSAQSARMRM